jgi:hypothetical protein
MEILMNMKRGLQHILCVQGIYFLLLGAWPILSIGSFMVYTGYKTDIWLVKAFGAILACEGICFLLAASMREISFPVVILAFMTVALLLGVDVHYNLDGVLGETYLVDAFVQFVLLVWWLGLFIKLGRSGHYKYT